jgi:solute carrier family 25 protein 34/35
MSASSSSSSSSSQRQRQRLPRIAAEKKYSSKTKADNTSANNNNNNIKNLLNAPLQKIKLPRWTSIPNACVASALAVCCTNPMDRAKTLQQLPGKNNWGESSFEVIRNMAKREGLIAGPYRGLPSAVAREASKNMFRIGLFTPLLLALHPPGKHRDAETGEEVPVPAWKRFVAGSLSGALGAVSSNPFDLVKTRMQVPADMCEYTGLTNAFATILKGEGWKAFYKGVGASVCRDMLGSSVNLTVQSVASEWMIKKEVFPPGSPWLGGLSGVLSAAASVAVMQPIDTSRAYVYLKPHIFSNSIEAMRYIVLKEGPLKLYKGAVPHFLRTAPHYAAMFSILEYITGKERVIVRDMNAKRFRELGIFDKDVSNELAKMCRVKVFKPKQEISKSGEVEKEMTLIVRGKALTPNSGVASSGSYFGEQSLIHDNYRAGETVVAKTSTTCLVVDKMDFKRATLRAQRLRGQKKKTSTKEGDKDDDTDQDRFTSATSDFSTDGDAMMGYYAKKMDEIEYREQLSTSWRKSRDKKLIDSVQVFKGMTPYERALIVESAKKRRYESGEKIIREGDRDKNKTFFVVLKGRAAMVARDADFDENELINMRNPQQIRKIVRTFAPGGHFGGKALLTGNPRQMTIVARGYVEALAIDGESLKELREKDPNLVEKIKKNLKRESDKIGDWRFSSMMMA